MKAARARVITLLVLAAGCTGESKRGTEDFTEEVASRMTANAERYRLEGWKTRSVEHTAGPQALTADNSAVEVYLQKSDEIGDWLGVTFLTFQGELDVEDTTGAPQSLALNLDATSATGAQESWTSAARSPDLLNAAQHPEIKFQSNHVEEGERLDGRRQKFRVSGELTIAGKTVPIEFPVVVENGDGRFSMISEFQLERAELGITGLSDQFGPTVQVVFRVGKPASLPADPALGRQSSAGPGSGPPPAAASNQGNAAPTETPTSDAAGGAAAQAPGGGRAPPDPAALFQQRDGDGDGKLTGDEIPSRMRERLEDIDRDNDGSVTLDELRARFQAREAGGAAGQPDNTQVTPPPAAP